MFKKQYFIDKDYDNILVHLLRVIPTEMEFNLIDRKRFIKESQFKEIFISSLSQKDETYQTISDGLLYHGFIKAGVSGSFLTTRGQKLKTLGNYHRFLKWENRIAKGEMANAFAKINWYWIEAGKVLIGALIGAFLATILPPIKEKLGQKPTPTTQTQSTK